MATATKTARIENAVSKGDYMCYQHITQGTGVAFTRFRFEEWRIVQVASAKRDGTLKKVFMDSSDAENGRDVEIGAWTTFTLPGAYQERAADIFGLKFATREDIIKALKAETLEEARTHAKAS